MSSSELSWRPTLHVFVCLMCVPTNPSSHACVVLNSEWFRLCLMTLPYVSLNVKWQYWKLRTVLHGMFGVSQHSVCTHNVMPSVYHIQCQNCQAHTVTYCTGSRHWTTSAAVIWWDISDCKTDPAAELLVAISDCTCSMLSNWTDGSNILMFGNGLWC